MVRTWMVRVATLAWASYSRRAEPSPSNASHAKQLSRARRTVRDACARGDAVIATLEESLELFEETSSTKTLLLGKDIDAKATLVMLRDEMKVVSAFATEARQSLELRVRSATLILESAMAAIQRDDPAAAKGAFERHVEPARQVEMLRVEIDAFAGMLAEYEMLAAELDARAGMP